MSHTQTIGDDNVNKTKKFGHLNFEKNVLFILLIFSSLIYYLCVVSEWVGVCVKKFKFQVFFLIFNQQNDDDLPIWCKFDRKSHLLYIAYHIYILWSLSSFRSLFFKYIFCCCHYRHHFFILESKLWWCSSSSSLPSFGVINR